MEPEMRGVTAGIDAVGGMVAAHVTAREIPSAGPRPDQYDKKFAKKAARYGLTPDQLAALIEATPVCNICDRAPKPGKDLYIDHHHKTGVVRGRLCFTCNYRLLGRGSLGKAWVHRRAADYLDEVVDWRRA
jgi:hypothetical protein